MYALSYFQTNLRNILSKHMINYMHL